MTTGSSLEQTRLCYCDRAFHHGVDVSTTAAAWVRAELEHNEAALELDLLEHHGQPA
jgi:hypothetical protein